MNTKKFFETPVLDVLRFTVEDIMSASGGGNSGSGNSGGGIELPDHNWE